MKKLFFLGLFCGCLYYGLKTHQDALANLGMVITLLLWARTTRPPRRRPLPHPTDPPTP